MCWPARQSTHQGAPKVVCSAFFFFFLACPILPVTILGSHVCRCVYLSFSLAVWLAERLGLSWLSVTVLPLQVRKWHHRFGQRESVAHAADRWLAARDTDG